MRASLESLPDLGNSQLETTLLHVCLALPKVSYHLYLPASYLTEAAEDLDLATREALNPSPVYPCLTSLG